MIEIKIREPETDLASDDTTSNKTCLVIIDMQNGFINEHTRHLISKIKEFIEKSNFDNVVATQYVNHPDTACYKFEGWKECMQGTTSTDIVKELKPLIQRTFKKDKYSCWNSQFKQFVKENKFNKLFFVGVNTGCCVLHSAFDAYNDLQDCCVIENLCGSTSGESSHKAAIQILTECITPERVIKIE